MTGSPPSPVASGRLMRGSVRPEPPRFLTTPFSGPYLERPGHKLSMLRLGEASSDLPKSSDRPEHIYISNGYGDSRVQKDAPNAGTSSVPTGSLSAPEAGPLTAPLAEPFR